MKLNLRAPTTAQLKSLRTSTVRAQVNLGPHLLVGCDTATLVMIEMNLSIARNLLAAMERDLDAEIARREPGCCQECQATNDEWDRSGEDRLAMLDRVIRAERAQLQPDSGEDSSPWHSFTPAKDDESSHPVGVGAPTEEIAALAAGWDPQRRTF